MELEENVKNLEDKINTSKKQSLLISNEDLFNYSIESQDNNYSENDDEENLEKKDQKIKK